MTNRADTVEKLRSILLKLNIYPDVASLKTSENLFAAGVMDSLILIQFVLAVEDEFKIRLANEDISYEQFQTLEKIADLLLSKYTK